MIVQSVFLCDVRFKCKMSPKNGRPRNQLDEGADEYADTV